MRKISLFGLLVVASVLLGFGCTSQPPPNLPPDDNNNPPLGSIYEDVRAAAIDAANEQFASFLGESDKNVGAEKMLQYLQSRPEFAASGVSGLNTYGVFPDGVIIVFVNNRDAYPGGIDPEPKDFVATKPLITAGVPFSADAFIGNSLGSYFNPGAPRITSMLSQGGYNVDSGPPTIEKLRSGISDAGVFYMDAHGGWGKTLGGQVRFGIWTASVYDKTNSLQYLPDLIDGSLIFMTGPQDSTRPPSNKSSRKAKVVVTPDYTVETHYGFTAEFVNKSSMSFSEDSVVFLNACDSTSQEATDLWEAFFAKGAAAYVGWPVTADDIIGRAAAWFFFDRLLGANTRDNGWFYPETPPQRPFDYGSIFQDMGSRPSTFQKGQLLNLFDYHHDNGVIQTLELLKNPSEDADFGLLSPTIAGVAVDAVRDQLILTGRFGHQEGSVIVGGMPLELAEGWAPDKLVCKLPRDAYGDVTVKIDGRHSNTVQLTQWDLHLVSKTVIKDPSASGEIDINIEANLKIRACLNNFRFKPHETPATTFTVPAGVTRSSTGKVDASGTQIVPPPSGVNSETFTGKSFSPQEFKVVYPGDMTDPDADLFTISAISCYANIDPAGSGLRLLFTLAGYYKLEQNIDGDITTSEKPTGFATNTYFDTDETNQFQLDGSYNIVAGKKTAKEDPNSTLEWSTTTAQSPPDPNALR